MLLENSNIQVDQALIVDEPWVSKIMAGEKIWEMRSTPNAKTGWVGLIRKGSGLIVGLMNINGSQGPLTKAQLHSHFDKHKVAPELINNDNYKWFHAWQITEVKRFDTPVRYSHPNGAVIWVNIDDAAKMDIQKQLGIPPEQFFVPNKKSAVDAQVDDELNRLFGKAASFTSGPVKEPAQESKQHLPKPVVSTLETKPVASTLEAKPLQKNSMPSIETKAQTNSLVCIMAEGKSISVVLTQGNVNNNHFYLPREGEFFPAVMWGGNNKSNEGTKAVFQFQGIEHPVETDIDGSKRILRSRGVIGAFFKLHQLNAGDEVVITRKSNFSFIVGFKKIVGVK